MRKQPSQQPAKWQLNLFLHFLFRHLKSLSPVTFYFPLFSAPPLGLDPRKKNQKKQKHVTLSQLLTGC